MTSEPITTDEALSLLSVTSGRLGEMQALAGVLAMNAEGRIGHDYEGLCPDTKTPDARDPKCVVCRTLAVLDETRSAAPTSRADG